MAILVSVIIPSKNEPLLQALVDDINEILGVLSHEILVIDKSRTQPSLRNAELIRQKSDGLGRAVLEALPHASGEFILIMDGDYSHDPQDLIRLVEAAHEYDVVLGSRYIKGGGNLDSYRRNQVSRAYNKLARLILRLPLTDPMSGFCVARRTVFDVVKLNPFGYKVNLELVHKARRKGFRVGEIPIIFRARGAGRSKAGVREGIRTFIFILTLAL